MSNPSGRGFEQGGRTPHEVAEVAEVAEVREVPVAPVVTVGRLEGDEVVGHRSRAGAAFPEGGVVEEEAEAEAIMDPPRRTR